MPPSWVEKRWKLKRGAFDLPRELLNQAEAASPQVMAIYLDIFEI
jgi:hypothetical protein